jgi:fibronectin type 3 domain-containing protein
VTGGPYTRLNSARNAAASYADSTVASGQTYYFVVTEVDSSGMESGYSSQATALIPTP